MERERLLAESPGTSPESLNSHRHERISTHEKTKAVLRLLKGEPAEIVSRDLGVSIRRVERWKDGFVAAGSAELGKRKDNASGWWPRHSSAIRQWIWLLIALVAVISLLAVFTQRGTE